MTTNDRRAESTEASLKRLEEAMGQIATTLSNLQQQHDKDKLPGQAHQAQAVTVLRSGKVIDNKVEMPVQTVPEKPESSKEKVGGLHKAADPYIPPNKPARAPFTPHVPYPGRLRNVKQEQQFSDFYKLLSKVNVNLPLLDIIRNVPAYVKFFKELASKKRNLGDYDKVIVSETANSIMQLPLPPKLRDPGSFIIKITLGNGKEASGMLDLGAGINLMPYSIFQQLELGELKSTRMSLQLADRSVRYPKGIIEDVLVKVGGLIVPVDFVVLEVGEVHEDGKAHTLLLGRPFMATTNTLLDVKSGTIKMSVLGESVSFSVRGSLNAPSAHFIDDCSFIDTIDPLVENEFLQEGSLEEVFAGSADEEEYAREIARKPQPVVELKELPSHLKYVYLEEGEKKPVIISSTLAREEEDALVAVLKENKLAFGWSLADIRGINPATCMHRIALEEGARPVRDAQRRLNPVLAEVVKKEVLKLLAEGLIFPIADSEWVSPVHVVSKKGGITVAKNDRGS